MNKTACKKETMALGHLLAALSLGMLLCTSAPAFAQDDVFKLVEEKRLELKAREDALKKEEERLNILRKDVEEKIEKYTKLLNRVDAALKKAEQIQDERLLNMAKLYESMSPEAAAAQLSALDTETAAQILLRMKSKKAGPVIALLKSQKAVILTKQMTSLQIKQ
jgi:flagellar motility protein MotE (MotC chaperone)